MALKDLIISKTQVSEELVEDLLKDRVQLIEENNEVYLLPEARNFPNTIRVLSYLCGKKAWSLLKNKEILTPIVELSNNLGIKGNTLRPSLKELRDKMLVESRSGEYFILPMGITYLQQCFEEDAKKASIGKVQKSRSKKREKLEGGQRKIQATGIKEKFGLIIEEGFFNSPKGLSEIQIELEKGAFKIPITSLPPYVIDLVRKGILEREKEKRDKRMIWVYKISRLNKHNHDSKKLQINS